VEDEGKLAEKRWNNSLTTRMVVSIQRGGKTYVFEVRGTKGPREVGQRRMGGL